MPGPVPKRSDERRRRNKDSRSDALKIVGAVEVPAADADWHPIARDWFESLAESGQSRFYEPSDWATAKLWTEVLSRQLASDRLSAQMMATWSAAATSLLATEGDRRRVRLEIERQQLSVEPAPVAALDDYRDL